MRLFWKRHQFFKTKRGQQTPYVFFSANLHKEEVADIIRSCNPVAECTTLLREALQKVDFGLNDKFCDAQDLRNSWMESKVSEVSVIFFSTLFNIYPNTSEEHEGLENEHEESEIGKHYQQWKLKSQTLLQILYYNTFRGAWKTPFHIMVGDSVHEKSKSKSLITSLNHAGLSVSYPEVILHHHNLAQDALKQSPSEVKMQSHFKNDSYTIGALTIHIQLAPLTTLTTRKLPYLV